DRSRSCSKALPFPISGLHRQKEAAILVSGELFEIVPDALVAVDADGAIVQVNSLTESLFGYKREELIGQKIEMLVPDRYRPAHREHRSDFDANPKVRRMGAGLKLYARRKDRTDFPVEIRSSPVRNGDVSIGL